MVAPVIQVYNVQGEKREGEVMWFNLAWQVANACTVNISNIGNVPASGSEWVTENAYQLTANGFGNTQNQLINLDL